MDLEQILRGSLHMGKPEDLEEILMIFRTEKINTLEIFLSLTPEDLGSFGVTAFGSRRAIKLCQDRLRASSGTELDVTSSGGRLDEQQAKGSQDERLRGSNSGNAAASTDKVAIPEDMDYASAEAGLSGLSVGRPELTRTGSLEKSAEYLGAIEAEERWEELGRGAFGTVYRARWGGDWVAVKVVAAGERAAVLREAAVHEQLRSRCQQIVRYIASYERGGRLYMVMDYYRLGSLEQYLAAQADLPPSRRAHLLRNAAQSLQQVHAAGVIHRDIAARNYLVTVQDDELRVHLTDFGLALAGGEAAAAAAMPWRSTAPEALLGEWSPAADVWSFGAMLYQVLSGRPLFDGLRPARLADMHAAASELVARHPGLPPSAHALFAACCTLAPAARPALPALVAELAALMAAYEAAEAPAPSWAPPVPVNNSPAGPSSDELAHFRPGPHYALSDGGRVVTGTKTGFRATALAASVAEHGRHWWLVSRAPRSSGWGYVGVAPADLDQSLDNSQARPGGGWYLYLKTGAAHSAGPPAVEGRPVLGEVADSAPLLVELDMAQGTLAYTLNGQRVVAYRGLPARPLTLAILLTGTLRGTAFVMHSYRRSLH